MKSLYRMVLVSLACAGGSVRADASSAAAGEVSAFASGPDGLVIFGQAGVRTPPPACSGDGATGRWAISTASVAGAAALDLLLTAQATHAPVVVVGTGACAEGLAVETAASVELAK